jgi:hypothetical protein
MALRRPPFLPRAAALLGSACRAQYTLSLSAAALHSIDTYICRPSRHPDPPEISRGDHSFFASGQRSEVCYSPANGSSRRGGAGSKRSSGCSEARLPLSIACTLPKQAAKLQRERGARTKIRSEAFPDGSSQSGSLNFKMQCLSLTRGNCRRS